MSREAARLRGESEAEAGGVGGVVAAEGMYRARIQCTEEAVPKEIKGPRRANEGRAKADLDAMRAAAAEKPTRGERFEAMQQEARRLQTEADTETGGVEVFQGGYRARIRYLSLIHI